MSISVVLLLLLLWPRVTATVTVTGDAGTGGFKVYELFSRHDWDGFYFSLSLFMFPIWSSVRARHQRGLGGVGVTAYHHRLRFCFILDLISTGILIPRAGHPCVGQLFHQKYHGLSV